MRMRGLPIFSKSLLALLVIWSLIALVGGTGIAQEAPPPSPLGIIIEPSGLQIDVWVDKAVYRVGERIHVYFSVNQQAYIYIIDILPDGRSTLIFPSCYALNNLMNTGEYVVPPDRFKVDYPLGIETVQAIASTEPLDLGIPTFSECFPFLGSSPEEAGVVIQGIVPIEGEMATDYTTFQITAGPVPPPPPPSPVNQLPVANFTYSSTYPLAGNPVSFDASSSYDPDGWITQYKWDFDSNGIPDAWGQFVSHTFLYSGYYSVTLTVTDNLGDSNSITKGIQVGWTPPPPSRPYGFYVTTEGYNRIRISVQGSQWWSSNHRYRIVLETDGDFTSIDHSTSGHAVLLGIVPLPPPGDTLTLNGSVRSGSVDYIIGFSHGTTKIKFTLQLDYDGDGDLNQLTSFVYIGPDLKHPPSNPFVMRFPSGTISFVEARICIVLIDAPGFKFIICFNF